MAVVTTHFTVTLSASYTSAVTVTYATADGDATAPTHYTATSGTLTFAPGETTKQIPVVVQVPPNTDPSRWFNMVLSSPSNATIADGTGRATIPGASVSGKYAVWFNDIYAKMKTTSNGYFGPPTGSKAFQYPYHAPEKFMVEAPDSGHQSVSETMSFWTKLEAWKIAISADKAGYEAMWASCENNFIPSATNQPWGEFTFSDSADYQPEQDTPNGYPVMPTNGFPSGAGSGGVDPIGQELMATYGNKNIYLMHWIIDVDGDYGYRNRDGTTQGVFINSYQRGMQESTWETITHPELEDWNNGGGTYGFLPIFAKGLPTYSDAPYTYEKQVRYTVAPDAEARMIASSVLADKFATEQNMSVATQNTKAKKMGDYLRYCLWEKYFHQGVGVDGTGFTGLISWYVSFGMQHVTTGTSAWGFRISSSNAHQGYQAPDICYAMATGGGGFTPLSSTAGGHWLTALNKQLELLRWLQTPEGAIAGGVTNSWKGRYETPTDGRQTNRFNGLYYTYAPEWHDPPSNKWFGFQAWSMERVSALMLTVATKSDSLSQQVRTKCTVLMDRWVNWLLDNAELIDDDDFSLPVDLGWTSNTAINGKTTTVANNEGVFEYLPSLNWNSSTGDHTAFWTASSVPNPNLKCNIDAMGRDLGSAACCAQVLIQYAQAKRTIAGGSLTMTIAGGSHTVREALDLGQAILDRIHDNYADSKGFTQDEQRLDYNRINDSIHIPAGFTGTMKNGDPINSSSTFISVRTFMKQWDGWADVLAYANGTGPAPIFRYHRFWHATEIAAGFAMLHKYFSDVVYT